MEDIKSGMKPLKASYPPKVVHSQVLGNVLDEVKPHDSRDIGRSTHLSGYLYYFFGDTFCKNADGEFVGVSGNNFALICNTEKPLESTYLSVAKSGMVEELVKLSNAEKEEQTKGGFTYKFWPFSGMVETRPGVGWMWVEKTLYRTGQDQTYYGMEAVRVIVEGAGRLKATRCPSALFKSHEPRVGCVSTMILGEHVYCFGLHRDFLMLARVAKATPQRREAYEFWTGTEYDMDFKLLAPLLPKGMLMQGAVIQSPLFGDTRPFVMVGCSQHADSKLMVSAAEKIEGPWELHAVCEMAGFDRPGDFRYCMYPHQWASAEKEGQLLVTCSEPWPGSVVGSKLQFEVGM